MFSKGICKSLFLLLFLSLTSAYGDTNILVNPGLENGTDGWAGRSCQIQAGSAPVHSGSGSVKATGRDSNWQGIKQSMFGKMTDGKTYRISGWVRLDNAPSAPVALSVEQQDGGGTKYHNVASAAATDSNWVLLSGNFTLEVNGTLSVLDVYFEGPPPGVNFYVDDANVYGPEPNIAKAKPVEPNATGQVDAGIRHQKIEGLGASGAFRTMEFVNHKQKAELYNLLFKELSLDIFRIRNTYDIDSNSFNETAEIVRGAKAALGQNLKIMISSWSPPARLKSNGKLIGGTLAKIDGKYMYTEFAKWWYDSVAAYAKAGVKADYITMQNEPDFEAKYDACIFAPTEDSNLAGYDTASEAVWQKLNSEMGQACPKMLDAETMGFSNAESYINKIKDLSHVYGYAHHLYDCSGCGAAPDRYLSKMVNFSKFNSQHGNKPLFQTEYQHHEPNAWMQAINTAILMHNSLTVEQAAAYLYWDLFWGPGTVSLVSLDDPCSYSINHTYYAFKQYSAFMDSGWQRVEASTENSGLRMSAYISPDNKKLTAVIINTTAGTDITLDCSFKDFSTSEGKVYRSSQKEKCVNAGDYSGSGPLKLPANSITTLALSAR